MFFAKGIFNFLNLSHLTKHLVYSGGFKKEDPGGKRSEGPIFGGKMKRQFTKNGLSAVVQKKDIVFD